MEEKIDNKETGLTIEMRNRIPAGSFTLINGKLIPIIENAEKLGPKKKEKFAELDKEEKEIKK